MKTKSLKTIRNICIVFLSFSLPLLLIVLLGQNIKNLEHIIPKTSIFGPLISILLMGLLSATPIPTDPIVILNGALFGPFLGVFISWMGNNLAAIIEYFIGRGLKEITNFETTKSKLPFGLNRFPADSVWFLLFGRLVPQFGGKVVSLVGGFYQVPLPRYIWTAFASNLFGSLLLALGGYSFLNLLIK